MILKPVKAVSLLLLVLAVLFSACQAGDLSPVVTVQSTGAANTPTVLKDGGKTMQPTYTPTSLSTPTVLPHLTVLAGELNGTKIEFWHPWNGETAEITARLVSQFNQSNEWGIQVNAKALFSAGSLFDAVAAGVDKQPVDLPAVIAAPEEHLTYWSTEKNLFFTLDDYIKQPGIGLSETEISAFTPAFWAQNQQNNWQIGIPSIRSANVLFYNVTWAKELGYSSPPKTPKEFKEQACAAAVHNNSAKLIEKYGTGGWLIDYDSLTVLSWLEAFGAQVITNEEPITYKFASKESQAAFSFLRGMQDEGCAWLKRMHTADNFFTNRLALFYSGTLQDMPIQKRLNELAKNGDEWMVIAYPGEDGKGVVYSNGYALGLVNSSGQELPPVDQVKNLKAGWLFVRWLSLPANLAMLSETLPSLPVHQDVEAQLEEKQAAFPWNSILPLVESTRPAPAAASWRAVRRLVEDAGWQIYQLPADQVGTILPHLDESVAELLK